MFPLSILLSLVAQDRLAVPDEAVQKEKERLIREIFKEEYAKAGPADRAALARKLLEQAAETKDDPVAGFVLLREARDLAAQAGALETALQAVDALAKSYEVSGCAMKLTVLSTLGKNDKDPSRIARALLDLGDEALAWGEYDVAAQACSAAVPLAKKAKDVDLSKRAAEAKTWAEKVKKAQEKLRADGADAPSNLIVGQFLCLVKADWEKGLPHLEKAPEGPWKSAAALDRADPTGAPEQAAVGDSWWTLAEKETAFAPALRRRAIRWYEKALPDLAGLSRTRVQHRLASAIPDLFGHWKFDETSGSRASDSSGNGRHGTVEGAVWSSGGLKFNGDQARVVLDAGEVPVPWTVGVWVLREDSPNGDARLIDSPAFPKGMSLRLEQADNRVGLTRYGIKDYSFGYEAPVGQWAHLVFVATESDTTLFVNGSKVDAVSVSVPLTLGRIGSHGGNSAKGTLDDVRVYRHALASDEIELLHRSTRK